jgi:hypothetical protein
MHSLAHSPAHLKVCLLLLQHAYLVEPVVLVLRSCFLSPLPSRLLHSDTDCFLSPDLVR